LGTNRSTRIALSLGVGLIVALVGTWMGVRPLPAQELPPDLQTAVAVVGTATAQAQAQRKGQILTRETDDMEMVYVPAGEFQMGSTDQQIDYAMQLCSESRDDCKRRWYEDEQPVHTVVLDAFWLDRTEVTNSQYQRCASAGVCDQSTFADDSDFNGDNQPVVAVDRINAQTYCQWAGARLPTEAEWEYAARGPEGQVYPWGNAFDASRGNFSGTGDGYEYTAPVGRFSEGASWVGALDLSGNVWEWVADWHGYYPTERQVNPTGPAWGDRGVLRGGSWKNTSANVRGADRGWSNLSDWFSFYGFRCARNP
jgi:formylglycine-generating enzyme required for sulfatase activity